MDYGRMAREILTDARRLASPQNRNESTLSEYILQRRPTRITFHDYGTISGQSVRMGDIVGSAPQLVVMVTSDGMEVRLQQGGTTVATYSTRFDPKLQDMPGNAKERLLALKRALERDTNFSDMAVA
jgi:hypothetical protein